MIPRTIGFAAVRMSLLRASRVFKKMINRQKEAELSHEALVQALDYDFETGKFRWKIRRAGRRFDLDVGIAHNKGYIVIKLNSNRYLAHRLAWFYMYAQWPMDQIDHINSDKADN